MCEIMFLMLRSENPVFMGYAVTSHGESLQLQCVNFLQFLLRLLEGDLKTPTFVEMWRALGR